MSLKDILNMPRFTCQCGRWIMLTPNFVKEEPLRCECGLKYYHEDSDVICIPGVLKPALVLDLDGTVRYSKHGDFINKPEDVVIYPGVERKLWEYRDSGYLILGASNQGGVAYGHKTCLSAIAEIEETLGQFGRNPFHIIKDCWHHPNGTVEPYNHRSLLRKPDIGMLALLEVECFEKGFIVDWDNSIFVGDRPEDAECAKRANIQFVHALEFFARRALEEKDEG